MLLSLWATEFNGEMPDGIDYKTFVRMREKKWNNEDVDWSIDYIRELKKLDHPGAKELIVMEMKLLAE